MIYLIVFCNAVVIQAIMFCIYTFIRNHYVSNLLDYDYEILLSFKDMEKLIKYIKNSIIEEETKAQKEKSRIIEDLFSKINEVEENIYV